MSAWIPKFVIAGGAVVVLSAIYVVAVTSPQWMWRFAVPCSVVLGISGVSLVVAGLKAQSRRAR